MCEEREVAVHHGSDMFSCRGAMCRRVSVACLRWTEPSLVSAPLIASWQVGDARTQYGDRNKERSLTSFYRSYLLLCVYSHSGISHWIFNKPSKNACMHAHTDTLTCTQTHAHACTHAHTHTHTVCTH